MKLQFMGIEEYADTLRSLAEHSEGICKAALYEGVKVVADEIRKEVEAIPVRKKGEKQKVKTGLTEAQKQGLLNGIGITKHEEDTFGVNAKVGFIGYNSVKTEKYPNGQPNALIARSLTRGTSYLQRHIFVKKAVAKARAPANAAIEKELIKRIEQVTK